MTAWGDDWPATITLGQAAERMEFDLFVDDDPDLKLVKVIAPLDGLPWFAREAFERQDHEDFLGSLTRGLDNAPQCVPPVVILPGDFRDGHHRVCLARERGLTHVPAYRADGATVDEEQHVGHHSRLGGTYWCDTCNSPYCDLA